MQADHHQWQHQRVHRIVHVDLAELALGDAAAHDTTHQLVCRLDDLTGVVPGDVRKVAHLGDHQLEHTGCRAVVQVAPPIGQDAAQQFAGAAVEACGTHAALGNAGRQVVADDRLEQLFLAGVIEVERALGHTGSRGHLFGAGGRKAFFDEQGQRCGQQFLGRWRGSALCMLISD